MWKSIGAVGLSLVMSAQGAMAEEGLPEKMLKRMKQAPEAFVADAADLILGYGQDGSIGKEGIEQAIAVERAAARASAMRRLMAGDLDGDGSVGPEEMAVLIRAEGAEGRGRLALGFADADRDGDGRVSAEEMQEQSATAGAKAVSAAKESALLALMQLDGDGNGALTLDEVRAAVEKVAQDI